MTIEKLKEYLEAKINYLSWCRKETNNAETKKEIKDRMHELKKMLELLDDEKQTQYLTKRFNEIAKEDQ